MEWNLQQVQQLFNGNFLNILIVEQFAFVCNLCEVDEEFCALFQSTVLTNIGVLNKVGIFVRVCVCPPFLIPMAFVFMYCCIVMVMIMLSFILTLIFGHNIF